MAKHNGRQRTNRILMKAQIKSQPDQFLLTKTRHLLRDPYSSFKNKYTNCAVKCTKQYNYLIDFSILIN